MEILAENENSAEYNCTLDKIVDSRNSVMSGNAEISENISDKIFAYFHESDQMKHIFSFHIPQFRAGLWKKFHAELRKIFRIRNAEKFPQFADIPHFRNSVTILRTVGMVKFLDE